MTPSVTLAGQTSQGHIWVVGTRPLPTLEKNGAWGLPSTCSDRPWPPRLRPAVVTVTVNVVLWHHAEISPISSQPMCLLSLFQYWCL